MKQIFNKYILIIFIFYTIWLGGVPFILSQLIPVVCDNVSYNSAYKVEVVKPRIYMNVVPTFLLKADCIKLSSPNNTLQIDNFSIKLRLLPLLSKRIHIDKVNASYISLNSKIDEKFKFDYSSLKKILNNNCSVDELYINKFIVNIDELSSKLHAEYEGANVYYHKNNRYLKLCINSRIKVAHKISIVKADLVLPQNNSYKRSKIDVYLSNFDIEPLESFFVNYLPKNTKKLKGIIDLQAKEGLFNVKFKNFAYINSDIAKSIIFPDEFIINSEVSINKKELVIRNAELKSQNISGSISGTILNYFSKSLSEINLDVRINSSKVEDIINMLPPLKTDDINIYKLKKYKFFGDVLGNLTINGDITEPSVNGSIFINNGILIKPIPKAKGAVIKLEFKGRYLNFDVVVPAGVKEKVFVLGGVELYNVKYSDMHIWSTPNVDLAIAENKIIPIHEILNFIIGPVPIMDIKGVGNIDIIVKGNRKLPHVWGALKMNNTTASFNDIPDMVLKDAAAELIFDDTSAEFKLKRGFVNDKEISINGTCTLSGKFDFDVSTSAQDLSGLYKILDTAVLIDDIKGMIPSIKNLSGLSNLKLKVYGTVKDINDIKFNSNLFAKGTLELLGNNLTLDNIKLSKTKGNIKFDNMNADLNLESFIGKSPLSLKALISDKNVDSKINMSQLELSELFDDDSMKDFTKILLDVDAKYKGNIENIEYKNIDAVIKVKECAKNNKIKLSNAQIFLKNGKLNIKNLNGTFTDTNSIFKINLNADDVFSKPLYSGNIVFKDFDLRQLNLFSGCKFLPQNIKKLLTDVRFDKGKVNINANIINNNIQASTDIGGIAFTYLPLDLPVQVVNGSIYIRKNYLGLNMINILTEGMPLLIDGGISDIFNKQIFGLYINSKPKQEFIDKCYNNNRIYPIKIKGDIIYWAKINGSKDDFEIKSEANMSKNSSVYYMGAMVGDLENSIILQLNTNVINKSLFKIKEFSYNKLVSSLGKKQTELNMLKANGTLEVVNDDIVFNNFRIKTSNPTDARIFNIIFRKPNIKQGQFTSDLKFNGKLSAPSLRGTFHIVETNIPFLDTTMKNLSFIFKDKTIELFSTGEVLGNDIKFRGILRNKLTLPYYVEDAELNTKALDLNYIIEKFKTSQVDNNSSFDNFTNFNLSNIVVNRLKLTAEEVKLRNLTAENIEAYTSMNNKHIFKIDNFKFNVANGTIKGNFNYNMNNNHIGLKLNTNSINANDLSIALFNLSNQLYGDLTGSVELNCNGANYNSCLRTLNGKTEFTVKDGKMPKLGSLEYLLKASNLLKGGITGLTMNSVIDILTPLKAGEFSDIYGLINISNGVADDIEIATKGKDLSLFISGNYNLASSNADMEVLGLLSTKITTMFGPFGNVSLNTLFNRIPGIDLSKNSKLIERINKIPGIELSGKSFRKFIAEIKGDINGENYVSSFKWVN